MKDHAPSGRLTEESAKTRTRLYIFFAYTNTCMHVYCIAYSESNATWGGEGGQTYEHTWGGSHHLARIAKLNADPPLYVHVTTYPETVRDPNPSTWLVSTYIVVGWPDRRRRRCSKGETRRKLKEKRSAK